MEPVVNIEAAEKEVNAWLDSLEVSAETRENEMIAATIRAIVTLVSKGLWIFNDDETVTVKLTSPLGENGITAEIKYNGRYSIGDWHAKIKNIPAGDYTGMVLAKLSLLSKLPVKLFEKFDNKDYKNHANVAVFF